MTTTSRSLQLIKENVIDDITSEITKYGYQADLTLSDRGITTFRKDESPDPALLIILFLLGIIPGLIYGFAGKRTKVISINIHDGIIELNGTGSVVAGVSKFLITNNLAMKVE